jgi:hypothetical protein
MHAPLTENDERKNFINKKLHHMRRQQASGSTCFTRSPHPSSMPERRQRLQGSQNLAFSLFYRDRRSIPIVFMQSLFQIDMSSCRNTIGHA